jgi:hypothetical protein
MKKIRLITIGHLASELNLSVIENWKSKIFKVVERQRYSLTVEPDLINWGYSDKLLNKELPTVQQLTNNSQSERTNDVDINFFIVDVPLTLNHFSRILSDNRVVVTYFEVKEILERNLIPLENFCIGLLYTYSLVDMIKVDRHMTMADENWMAHSACKHCLFDMCGIKEQVVRSCNKPTICGDCELKLKSRRVSEDVIETVKKELKSLKRNSYEMIKFFLKSHPKLSLLISFIAAIIASVIANLFGSLLNLN